MSTQIFEPCAATPITNAPTSSSHSLSTTTNTASTTAASEKQMTIQVCLRTRCVASGVTTAARKNPKPDAANAFASPASPASTSSGSLKYDRNSRIAVMVETP